MAVQGWTAEPVDHDPFSVRDSSRYASQGQTEAVIPEPDASIRAQHQALLDPNDPREAMLYNPGQQPIKNPHLGQTQLQDGRVVQFDRQGLGALTPQRVAAYDRSNRLNELLQYGPVSKDDAIARATAGEQPVMVTTTRNGVPVKEAAGTMATVPAQVAAQHATRGPFDRVEVNHPASVFGRLGFQGGGGLDDDPENDVASGATGENANERRGQAAEGDMAGQAGSGRTGPGYPEAIPGLQSGAYLGGSGSVGLGAAVSDFAPAEPDAFHEWTGGRVGFQDGGGVPEGLEPVEGNPFDLQPPDRTMHPSDLNRAKGFPEPRSDMHDRIAAASQDVDSETGLPSFDPATNVPQEPRKQVYGGKWGKAAELGYEKVADALGGAMDWAGNKLEQGVSGAAGAVGVPNPELLGRDVRAMVESPVLGEAAGAPRIAEEPRPRPAEAGSDVSAAAAPARVQIMEINGVKRHIDPEFPESRVGTSVPTKVDANAPIDAEEAAHANNNMHVGMELAAGVPKYGNAVANMVRSDKIPYVKAAQGADDAAVQESLIEHMKDNLLGLYNRVSGAVRSGSKLWYEGANTRSRNIAQTHDIPHENAAGVVAAMSPQKDWDQNVALADWVAHTAGTTAHDATMTPEMTDWVNRYALRKDPERVETDPETGKETRFNAKTGEEMSPNSVSQQDVQRQLAQVNGKPWSQMTPDQKAFYTRAYYEAHGPPGHLIAVDDKTGDASHWIDDKEDRKYGYYINNPDGTHNGVLARYGDEYPNKKGQPIPVSWGSTGEVANAIQAFGANSMSDISEALGNGHKVRSFFNNIIAPWSKKGDVTSDTHAVAAALLRPLGAGSPEAASGMGAASPNNAETGLNGFYPHVAEAYRRAAKEAGILPRELQSITWEALRGLWSAREKSAKSNVKKAFVSPTDATNAIWRQYKNGEISMQDAHNAILGPNGEKIRPPRWFDTFRP